MFCTVGFGNAFGVFQEYYQATLLSNESESNIGWLGAINIFMLFAGSLITGPILDLFGPVVGHPSLTCNRDKPVNNRLRSCFGSARLEQPSR